MTPGRVMHELVRADTRREALTRQRVDSGREKAADLPLFGAGDAA